MIRRFPAAKIIVVERGQVVVDQGVSVNEFESAADGDCSGGVRGKELCGFVAQNRANAFATGENAVAHGGVDGCGRRGVGRQKLLESGLHRGVVLLEKSGALMRFPSRCWKTD